MGRRGERTCLYTGAALRLFRSSGNGDAALGAAAAVNEDLRITYVQRTFLFYKPGDDFADVSGLYHTAELDVVHTAVHQQVVFENFGEQLAGALGHHLTEDDAGHDGVAGEVALAIESIGRDGSPGMGVTIRVQ